MSGKATRVLFLSHSGADSGAEQATLNYLAHWPQARPRPTFVLGEHGAVEARAAVVGVDVEVAELDARAAATRRGARVGGLALAAVGLARHARRIGALLRARQTDVVVAVGFKALVYGWLAARRSGATIVWSLHDRVDRRYFPWFLVPVLRFAAPRLVDGLVVNSASTRETVRPGRTPVVVAVPGIEPDPREFHEPGETVRRVVMMGRLSPWKGQDVFLRAFAATYAGTDAVAYVVGGALFGEDDYERGLHDLAAGLGVGEQVRFVGHVTDPWEYLVDADVLVHCSTIPEPFGQVVVQGMWARCAVVASAPGGPAEVVTDGVDGLLVPCGDERALTRAMARLRDDADLRRRLARQGRLTAQRYDVAGLAPVLADWLSELPLRGR